MRSPRLRVVPAAALLALFLVPRAALADIPGPRPICDADGHGCAECWRPYTKEADETFTACASAAKAKGLVEACSQRQGAGAAVFFCPQGVKVETKIVGGGCAGCTVGARAEAGGVVALVAALAALALRRHRRSGRGSSSGA